MLRPGKAGAMEQCFPDSSLLIWTRPVHSPKECHRGAQKPPLFLKIYRQFKPVKMGTYQAPTSLLRLIGKLVTGRGSEVPGSMAFNGC